MKLLKKIPEEEMVALFLKAEFKGRFRKDILSILRKDKADKRVIENPDSTNIKENKYRERLIGEFRGYKRSEKLFPNFPSDMKWYIAKMSKRELRRVKYFSASDWTAHSDGTRKPDVFAKKIFKNPKIKDHKVYFKIYNALKKGKKFPPLIIVSSSRFFSKRVLLEGHARLTAYAMGWEFVPKKTDIIIGFSKKMKNWKYYKDKE